RVIGESAQYASASRVVTSTISPFSASRSTGSRSQNNRSAPLSFCLPIACSAQFSEKNRVSPQKYAPCVNSSVGRVDSSIWDDVDPKSVPAFAAGSGHPLADCGALHHSSSAGGAVCVGAVAGSTAVSGGMNDASVVAGGSAPLAAADSRSAATVSDSSGDFGICVSTVFVSKSDVKGLFKTPITFGFASGRRSAPNPDM